MLLRYASPLPSVCDGTTTASPRRPFVSQSLPRRPINTHHLPLSLLPHCRTMGDLRAVHALVIKESRLHRETHLFLGKLVEFCALSPVGDLSYAVLLFDSVTEPDHFLWNTIIRGYSLTGSPVGAVLFYVRMLLAGTAPNSHTFPFLLKACTLTPAAREGRQVHAQVLKLGFASDPFVHTSLINMYARNGDLCDARRVFDVGSLRDAVPVTALINGYASCGQVDVARRVFDEMPIRDVVSWNAMIAGHARSGQFQEALCIFQEMLSAKVEPNESTMVTVLSACAQSGSIELGSWVHHWIDDRGLKSNLRLASALVDMYSKCGDLNTARDLFDSIRKRDQVCWNVMIGGYAQVSCYKEALTLFRQMQLWNGDPNEVTFLNILPACAHLGALDVGKWVHACIERRMGVSTNRNIGDATKASLFTGLIDMYAKCGSIESAQQVFKTMPTKNLSSWNAMIAGLAMHGHAEKAFRYFDRMNEELYRPDDITFVGVLSACSHAGLVEKGRFYFSSMIKDHGILPKVFHYGCMVDLLGRAGLLKEAELLIRKMDVKPDGAIWSSLLGACRVHRDIELAEFVAGRLIELEPENAGAYVLLSNIYAAAGRWDDVARVRTSLNNEGIKKVPGSSSIEVDRVVHEFLVGDKSHPQSREIYKMLDEIAMKLQLAGHIADTPVVLHDLEDEWKEGTLCYHSEKLAIAFGLLSTNPGTTIRIVKNLRVCGNCHSELKLISKLYSREIIARDGSRFHHLKNGVCSCNDFW